MEIIKIREPYLSAGKKFKWAGKSIGIGLAISLLKGEGELSVQVMTSPKDIWIINKKYARELVGRYKAFYTAKGTKLGIVPWWGFRKYLETEKQQSLF